MNTIQKTYRIDKDLQQQADHILAEMGLNASTAITMLLKRIVAEEKFPFTPEVVTNEQSVKNRLVIQNLSKDIPTKHLDLNNPTDLEEFFSE